LDGRFSSYVEAAKYAHLRYLHRRPRCDEHAAKLRITVKVKQVRGAARLEGTASLSPLLFPRRHVIFPPLISVATFDGKTLSTYTHPDFITSFCSAPCRPQSSRRRIAPSCSSQRHHQCLQSALLSPVSLQQRARSTMEQTSSRRKPGPTALFRKHASPMHTATITRSTVSTNSPFVIFPFQHVHCCRRYRHAFRLVCRSNGAKAKILSKHIKPQQQQSAHPLLTPHFTHRKPHTGILFLIPYGNSNPADLTKWT
jgi:hypothetical protein